VSVIPLPRLSVGQTARIERIDLGQEFTARLRALGMAPGQSIALIRQAPCNGPLHLRLGTTEIMLRRDQACSIHVTPSSD
jgi:ferrous iron transport protein A